MLNNSSDIDLVYLWVDDSDKIWQEKKKNFEEQNNIQNKSQNKDAISSCRFSNNDELKYSLRSVEKNIPWINKIYIITDNQTPSWLNLSNDKIKIINHTDIIPKEKLPLYNSCAIETRIPYIEGLSEKFIYANDDMLFWQPLTPDFFFEGDKPIYIAGKKIYKKKYKFLYGHTVVRAYNLIKDRFGADIPYFSHHNADPYRKTLFSNCIKDFQDEFDKTLDNHFRSFDDIQRTIIMYYSIAKNEAVLKKNKTNFLSKLFLKKPDDSLCFNIKLSTINKIKNANCKLLCVNDSRKTTDEARNKLKEVLEMKFNKKSQFEK